MRIITRISRFGGRPRRRGFAVIYVALLIMVLFGFVAMGIDIGRVRLAKTELQGIADAAARTAVRRVPDQDFAGAIGLAIDVASKNTAAAKKHALLAEDVEFGFWNLITRQFTVLTGADRTRANAVRVTARRIKARGEAVDLFFAPVIGWDSMDVQAKAVAMIRGEREPGEMPYGIVGINWIELNGITRTDSYDPSKPYVSQTPGNGGTVLTNGSIRINGTVDIYGDARPGLPDGSPTDLKDPDGVVTTIGSSTVHGTNPPEPGWTAPLDRVLEYDAPTAPSTYNNQPLIDQGAINNKGNVTRTGIETLTLPGGTYYVDGDFSMIGANTSLVVEGPVKLYVSGNVKIEGNVTVNSGIPADFEIIALGTGGKGGSTTVDLGGGSALYAHVYAPLSDVTIHGTSDAGFFGAIIGKTLDIMGNSAIHYDGAGYVPNGDGNFHIQLVD